METVFLEIVSNSCYSCKRCYKVMSFASYSLWNRERSLNIDFYMQKGGKS